VSLKTDAVVQKTMTEKTMVQIGSACLKSEIQKSMVTSFAKMADDTFC
jgi:hypothetical protein